MVFVDEARLVPRMHPSDQRPAELPPLQICLQLNVDGGTTKSGVMPDELMALAQSVATLPRLKLRGLMSIPEPAIDFLAAKSVFERVKAHFDALNRQGFALDTLSMGMSADLEAAIHAGSTMVRVGSAIFGARH